MTTATTSTTTRLANQKRIRLNQDLLRLPWSRFTAWDIDCSIRDASVVVVPAVHCRCRDKSYHDLLPARRAFGAVSSANPRSGIRARIVRPQPSQRRQSQMGTTNIADGQVSAENSAAGIARHQQMAADALQAARRLGFEIAQRGDRAAESTALIQNAGEAAFSIADFLVGFDGPAGV